MSDEAGFIAIHRWRVEPELEQEFRTRWRKITAEARKIGSFGSLLGRAQDGHLVAIALWPSSSARDAAFAKMSDAGEKWPPAERLSETCIDVIDDLWTVSPFAVTPTASDPPA